MRAIQKLLKFLLILVLVLVVAAAGLIGYLTLTEYNPAAVEPLEVTLAARQDVPSLGVKYTALSWNLGYGCLGRDQNFFMDGGTMVRPEDKKTVEENMAGILGALTQQKADVYLLQEVDLNAYRSHYTNEMSLLGHGLSMSAAFAYNFNCDFVPIPWPPIGKVESGVMTLTNLKVTEATRHALHVPFTWPVRVANMKRCLLVERTPIQGGDKELVMINLHMDAYDDGIGKRVQTEQLIQLMQEEYKKGNYVVAGGDFNQTFPDADRYPLLNPDYWQAGVLTQDMLPEGFAFVNDPSVPTCRLLNENYSGDRATTQFYVIDGFIITPNIKVNNVQTIDLNFRNTDHQPVRLEFTMMENVDG